MHKRRTLRTALFILGVVGLNALVLMAWVMVTRMLAAGAMPGLDLPNGASVGGVWAWARKLTVVWLVTFAVWGVLLAGLTVLVRRMLGPASAAGRHAAADQPRTATRGRYANGQIDEPAFAWLSRDPEA